MEEAQVFVKIDEYKDALDVIGALKDKLQEAKSTLRKIEELKGKEDSELSSWSSSLDEIERKIEQIDDALSEPESL